MKILFIDIAMHKKKLNELFKYNFDIFIPKKELCTDNAIMIAWAGIEKLKANKIDPLNFKPLAKWDL